MIETIENTYSNRVLIIDEVHNIRTEEGDIKSRDTINILNWLSNIVKIYV